MESACRRRSSAEQPASSCSVTSEPEPVKEEPEWVGGGQSRAPEVEGLYAGHEVKEEVVVGPEVVQQQDVSVSMQSGAYGPLCNRKTVKQYRLKSCSVRLERLPERVMHCETVFAFKIPEVPKIRSKAKKEPASNEIPEGLQNSKRRRTVTVVPRLPSSSSSPPSLLGPSQSQPLEREDSASNAPRIWVRKLPTSPTNLLRSIPRRQLLERDRAANVPSPAMIRSKADKEPARNKIPEGLQNSKRRRIVFVVRKLPTSPTNLLRSIPRRQLLERDGAANVPSPAMVRKLPISPSNLLRSIRRRQLLERDDAANVPSPAMVRQLPSSSTSSAGRRPLLNKGLPLRTPQRTTTRHLRPSTARNSRDVVSQLPSSPSNLRLIPQSRLLERDGASNVPSPALAPPLPLSGPSLLGPTTKRQLLEGEEDRASNAPSPAMILEDRSSVGELRNTPTEINLAQTPQQDLAMMAASNLGSESSSDDSDEDGSPCPIISRVRRAAMDTPEDDEPVVSGGGELHTNLILEDRSSVVEVPNTPTENNLAQTPQQDLAMMTSSNLGSESSSEDGDEDNGPYPIISRVLIAAMDTPEDDEPVVTSPPHPPVPELHTNLILEDCSSVVEVPHTPTESNLLQTPQQDLAMMPASNLGSESESDASDEDDAPRPIIPRVLRAAMNTPDDEEPVITSPPHSSPDPTSSTTPESKTPLKSSTFLDFQWSPLPNPPIPEDLRRESFTHTNIGPTAPHAEPYDIFIDIWDQQFMEHIASETNKYAKQLEQQKALRGNHSSSRIGQWKDTTADELYVFFAILLAMGMVAKGRVTDYWSINASIFSTPGFNVYMPLKRFQLLSRCLHFRDNNDMSLEVSVSEAKIYKIQPVVDHLNTRFQSMYNLQQNIALDESLLQKGWDPTVPNKSAAGDIGTYELCEPQTGYLYRFVVHARKRTETAVFEPLQAFTPNLVLTLLAGLENRGHTVWMDSQYNSPALARKLKTLGFDCVGTLSTNRQFVPKELRELAKEDLRPGQIAGFTSGDVDTMVWRADNCVAAISTYHGAAISHMKGITRPALIYEFNVMMGAVDKRDRMLAAFPVERKRTKVWYKKCFCHLLNVSVLNSFVIWKSSHTTYNRDFRRVLIESILSRHVPFATAPTSQPSENGYSACEHYLAAFEYDPTLKSRKRRRCVVCKKRGTTYCAGCNKTACMKDCFLRIHL